MGATSSVVHANDAVVHERTLALGYKSMISIEVVHRHLSLLNIYDYWDYSRAESIGRYRTHSLSDFDRQDLNHVRSLGFSIGGE